MDTNNQNTNTCCNGEQKCDCKMCQKWGWCPGVCMEGKGHRILGVIILVLVLLFVGRMIFGGHGGWRDNDQIINTISVSGKGEINVTPDIANISFGVTAENIDVAKAKNESADKMNKIIDFLKNNGVDKKDIQTTNYSIYPKYDYLKTAELYYGGKQVLSGYAVNQTVSVKIRNLDNASKILSGVADFKVTDVSGLAFGVDKQNDLKLEARALAITDAKTQAEVLAKSLGVRLVKITSFSESRDYPVYYDMMKSSPSAMEAGGSSPELPVGENTITSNVTITYEIR